MSDREKLPEWIDRYNNNELEGEELEKFLALLRKNPRLLAEVRLDKDLNEILKDEELMDLRKKIAKIRKKSEKGENERGSDNLRIFLLAAMILVLVGIVFLMFWITRSPGIPGPGEQIVKSDTMQVQDKVRDSLNRKITVKPDQENKKERKTLLAENFRPDPALEGLVGSVTRNMTFKLLTPKDSTVFPGKSEIVFSWTGDGKITLMIMNNNGKIIAGPVNSTRGTEKMKGSELGPGLYYFKIIKGEELVHVGKFIIN